MIFAFAIVCKKGKSAQREAGMALQQSGAVNTMIYGVQPQHPGAFGQPGAPPIVQPASVTPIVYGPHGEVSYYPATKTGIPSQPYGNTEPRTTHDSEDFVVMSDGHQVEPTAPVDSPPSYDDVISKDTPTED
ncbi:uncharacterized protein LOC119737098 [Patiria miniata]|uniref:Uncharacterized protein n=1 Tax=Patiria miniata TaxID=46514 RepID=A0A914AUD2_PATMI|nr:uncharacterized protein LOC119737098 [Patiria miniata]